MSGVQVRQCMRPDCSLRYPQVTGHPYGERCPRCGASTRLVLERPLDSEPIHTNGLSTSLHLEVLLDNIRSAWNVGSMFRTADGLGIRALHLCGVTPTPDNTKVTKTSLGAEQSVAWCHYNDGVQAALTLRERGLHLWALERDSRAESLLELSFPLPDEPLLLVVGNEVAGVDPGILELCERLVYIPMLGVKRSFNAAVAFGIAATYLLFPHGS